MKITPLRTLLFVALVFLGTVWDCSQTHAQSESESSIHEMPKADQCSVIIIHIRELVFSLKQVARKISRLEEPDPDTSVSRTQYDERMTEYNRALRLLNNEKTALRQQIDLKEQQLADCAGHPPSPEQGH